MIAEDVRKELNNLADPEKAVVLQRFFKTGPGQYGEGDIFLGITVPKSREVAKKFSQLALEQVRILLHSGIHEERMVALLILVRKYAKVNDAQEQIAKFYLENIKKINNWDLVDLTAPNILGSHLVNKDRRLLYKLAKSPNTWERRIAIVSTLHFIKHHEFEDTLRIAGILLKDDHDLIHKAVGWMLREVGKRDVKAEENFLNKYYQAMPRTMLRYAIEKFPDAKKRRYMKKS